VLVEEGFVSAQHQLSYLEQLAAFSVDSQVRCVLMSQRLASAQHELVMRDVGCICEFETCERYTVDQLSYLSS
jgi:hypothetical protein